MKGFKFCVFTCVNVESSLMSAPAQNILSTLLDKIINLNYDFFSNKIYKK